MNKSDAMSKNTGGKAQEAIKATPVSKTKLEKKLGVLERIKLWWNGLCTDHPWVARIGVAVITCALLWLLLWFVLFSGLSGSADLIYSKF